MKYGRAEFQVEAEDQAGGTDYIDNSGQVGKGVERLEPDNDLARAAGEYFEGAPRVVGSGVHQEGPCKSGVELRQLPEKRSLERASLDCIEIRHIALVHTERRVEGAEKRNRVAGTIGHQVRREWRILGAVASPRMHGHSTSQVQHGNDLHARS
jgi:hypothetical protein